VDNSIPAWEQRDDESSLWFDRLYRFYLQAGPSRSVNGAYRLFREQAQSGLNPATQLRAPGPWREAAVTYEWSARARLWDEEQRRIERQAHQDAVTKANELHLMIIKSRTNAFLRVVSSPDRQSKWNQMSISEERLWMTTLIDTDRMLLSQPILAEDSRVVPSGRDMPHGSPAENATAPHQDRFAVTSGELVEAFLELERRETVPEPTMEVDTDAKCGDSDGPICSDQAGALVAPEERPVHPSEPGLPEVQQEATGLPGT
jgi:hypothetical protein